METQPETKPDFVQIGWIAHGMNKTRIDSYQAIFERGKNGKGEVRVPPKIYLTESVANRYGKAVPVFIKIGSDH